MQTPPKMTKVARAEACEKYASLILYDRNTNSWRGWGNENDTKEAINAEYGGTASRPEWTIDILRDQFNLWGAVFEYSNDGCVYDHVVK